MKKNIRFSNVYLAAISYGLGNLMMVVNRLDIPGEIHRLETGLDRAIPLVLPFIIPYFLYFGFVAFAWLFLFFFNPVLFRPFAVAAGLNGLITGIINATFQTYAPRVFVPGESLFADMLRWHYSLNRPLTSFPSLHVSVSFVCAHYLSRMYPKLKIWLYAFAWIVTASTFFVKEHYIADAIAGVILGAGIPVLVDALFKKREARQETELSYT
ncbi:MAG TPA: phosphatase PAP2 family protein [bacterium]|nr:phosphatase PAP2 family protein [bacterium]